MSGTETKGILCYLGCVLALALIAACQPTSTPTIEPTPEGPTQDPGPGPTPQPPAFDFEVFEGTYIVNATKRQDTGCNFRLTFAGQIRISVNKDGSLFVADVIEQSTRTYPGTIQQNGNFNASGPNTFSVFTANGTLLGQVSGNNISATETLRFTVGPPNCVNQTVVYEYTGSK